MRNKEGEIIRRAQEESLKILKKTKEEMDLLYKEFKAGLEEESQRYKTRH